MILCPHCGGQATIRRSEQITVTVRDLTALCDNDDCGHRFAAQLVAVRTIQPSLRPNPLIALPIAAQPIAMPRPTAPANDDERVPANDDRPAAAIDAGPVTT